MLIYLDMEELWEVVVAPVEIIRSVLREIGYFAKAVMPPLVPRRYAVRQ